MVRASHLRAIGGRAGKLPDPAEPTPIPGTPTFIRKTNGSQHQIWSNSHTVNISITVPYSGGAILVPFWVNSSNWVPISGVTRNVATNVGGNTVNQGTWMDAWAGSGGESHGGMQVAWIINPTIGPHNLTVTGSAGQNYEILGAGALFFANCSTVTASGTAGGGPANSRTFNVASATGRTTLGVFLNDNPVSTVNGTKRWEALSLDTAGWVDRATVQELPGAASVTHSISGGGGAWGFGLDLAA